MSATTIFLACRKDADTPSPPVTLTRTSSDASANLAKPKTVIAAFDASEFFSMADAEAKAGFHIAVPSPYYPMGFGRTYLRAALDGTGTFSTTQYTYPPLAPHSIGVDAGPATVSGFAVDNFKQKEPRTIGGKAGWLLRNDGTAIQFAYPYGDPDAPPLLCIVQAPAEVGFDAFELFVESLH